MTIDASSRYPTIYKCAVDESTAAIKTVIKHFSPDKWHSFAGPIVLSALIADTFRQMNQQQPDWFRALGKEGRAKLDRDIRRKLNTELGNFL